MMFSVSSWAVWTNSSMRFFGFVVAPHWLERECFIWQHRLPRYCSWSLMRRQCLLQCFDLKVLLNRMRGKSVERSQRKDWIVRGDIGSLKWMSSRHQMLRGEIKFFQDSCFEESSEISFCFEETNERVDLEQYFAKEKNCLQIWLANRKNVLEKTCCLQLLI